MSNYDYDLFVVGGGSGGVRAARLAGGLKKRVGLAEGYRMGGTCVIRGCVPKKLMFYASEYKRFFDESCGFGWSLKGVAFDWTSYIKAQNKELSHLEGLYKKGLLNNNVDIHHSYAQLLDPHTILLLDTQKKVTAKNILIATGSIPHLPEDIKGIEHALTSNDAFLLKDLPKSMIIVGGGYISLELACIFYNLGVKITVVCRGKRILKNFDTDIASSLQKNMIERGISILLETEVTSITKKNKSSEVIASLSTGQELKASEILFATGRRPATENLGLENAQITQNKKGAIITDAYKRTNQPHIFAVGDVTDQIQLTPVAIHEAMCVLETLYHNNPTQPDYELIATAVFSQPELASIGPSEEECVKIYKDVEVYRAEFRSMRSTISGSTEKTLLKLLVEKKTNIVRATHLVGPHAGEMIQLLGIALKAKLSKKDFDATMAVHPTAAEELVTMYKPSYVYTNGERID